VTAADGNEATILLEFSATLPGYFVIQIGTSFDCNSLGQQEEGAIESLTGGVAVLIPAGLQSSVSRLLDHEKSAAL